MKAKGQSNLGGAIAAGAGAGAAIASALPKRTWDSLNSKHPQTGAPHGPLAVRRQQLMEKMPFVGRRAIINRQASHDWYNHQRKSMGQSRLEAKQKYYASQGNTTKAAKYQAKLNAGQQKATTQAQRRASNVPVWRRAVNRVNRGRNRQQPPTGNSTP